MFIFKVAQESFIDMNNELVLLTKQIDWESVASASEFAEYYYVGNGRPSIPIRKIVGTMLLKSVFNLSDEGVVARWMENPYMKYFTDEKVFRKRAGVEPAIGHLKSDDRMMRNYLKYSLGDVINTIMAAVAYNMRHWMNKKVLSSFVSWLRTLVERLENGLFVNENKSVCQYSAPALGA